MRDSLIPLAWQVQTGSWDMPSGAPGILKRETHTPIGPLRGKGISSGEECKVCEVRAIDVIRRIERKNEIRRRLENEVVEPK